ncbi:alpha/beta fold hydrolase [Glaciimonas sp. PCH181]|uniref:alpha/beta fold hydrolase n=1 Tax=Glaciimonas sp. PCH181 TaxID=2133943 RepID=UPI000D3841E4|nr:alpha/beta fold hydrolase [Glaciimonas sp. PCH181]PUA17708.1 alpha/beta hydrolase [Glaciimonas sp. PCH181]
MTIKQILGADLYVKDVGQGEPVLLIHGITNFHRSWAGQIDSLVQQGYRVIVPDLPGHGDSAPLQQKMTVDALAATMAALLDDMGIATAHLCGVSLGGMVAMTFALRYPQRVKRLIVADTAARFDSEPHQKMLAGWTADFLAEDGPLNRLKKTWPMLVNEAFRSSADGDAAFKEWVINAQKASGSSYAYVCDGLVEYNIENALNGITQPTLVLVGSEDKMLTPVDNQAIADKIPGALFEVIKGGSHLPNVDSAQAFNAAVLRFLDKA